MKFIEKNIEDARTGSISEHHTVTGLQLDYVNNSTFCNHLILRVKSQKRRGKREFKR